ncbi:MAG: class E sortase [bacterium]|nr:class E sortase [bacterium]
MDINDLKNPAIMQNRKRKIVIAGFIVLIIGGIVIASYPFWPAIKYNLFPPQENIKEIPGVPDNGVNQSEDQLSVDENGAVVSNNTVVKTNLLIIPKIGVKISIVEGTTESALNKGAWRLPETSTPDKGSNTVITGHRWKYRPPSEKTFYLLNKLVVGDTFKITWDKKDYNYKVIGMSIVSPTDVWVLNPTQKSIVTLITCTPLFSTSKRLIVKAELVE